MNYKFISKGTTWTDAMREAIGKHFFKLEKYLADEPVKVSITTEGDRTTLKVQVVTAQNKRVRAEETGEDFYDLVCKVRDSIDRQIKKTKAKLTWKERITRRKEEDTSEAPLIEKVKTFHLEEITPEMAIEELEKLGHPWYAFLNANDGNVCIVYARFDGGYSLVNLK